MKPGMPFLLLALLALPAWADTGSMIRDDTLRSAPSASAAKVASVSKGSSVEVLARQGGWTQIRAGSHTGWVRILSVRGSVSGSSAGDLAALASRRDNQVVAVAGLRGLNEEELKAARFNPQELMLLDRYQVDQTEAKRFARAANLVARQIPYLPAPETDAPKNGTQSQFWWEEGK
jgi:hypothetical protein